MQMQFEPLIRETLYSKQRQMSQHPLPLLANNRPLIASAVHLHGILGGNEIPLVMDGLSVAAI